jgi:hypothetical protein
MKSSTLIVWLLVAACIAIDLAMIGELQIRRNEWPEAVGLIGLGLSFSQIALLALWAVWGRSNVVVRGVSTLLGVWAVSCLASYSREGDSDRVGVWFGVLLFYCGASLIPFIMVRIAGYEISSQRAASTHHADSHVVRRLSANQFTIWGILSLTTAIGVALAVIRFAQFPMGQLLEVVAFCTLLAGALCAILLLALFLSRTIISIAATTVICPIVGVLLSHTGPAPAKGTLELVLMMCVLGVAIVSAAIVLKTAGYRLVRLTEPGAATALRSSEVLKSVSVDQADEL